METETKFTPGPWVVCVQEGDDVAYTVFAKSQLRDGRIAADEWDDCIALAGLNHNESEANAHLIAAAPELYEACKKLLYWADTIAPTPELANDRKTAIAVLSKARGEP